jgi:two-component system, OmpR family, sensor histidine kinase VicK
LSNATEVGPINGYRDNKMNSSHTDGESRALLPEENYDAKVGAAASPDSPSDYEEKTEVIYGEENVTKWAVGKLSTITKSLDLCGDRYGPSIILATEQVMQGYIELHARGVKQRVITEITEENIMQCKQLMKFQELRHLDGLKGYFSIADGRLLAHTAFGQESKILPHIVASTVRVLVEQQQYLFETLWNKAIPAKQRLREIEGGTKREFVETIRDPSEIQRIGFDLIKKAEEEILILFSTPNAFFLQDKVGGGRALELLKGAVSPPSNVKIRILMPAADNNNNPNRMTTVTEERILQLKELGIDIRRTTQRQHEENFLQNNNLTLLIVDRSSYLTVELDDDTTGSSEEESIGLATYSNSDATVFAYISIFENLWMRTQA